MGSREDDLCRAGRTRIEELAKAIAARNSGLLRLANEIYWTAWQHGAWIGQPGERMDDEATCPELAEAGAEFLQLADALEQYQDHEDGAARTRLSSSRPQKPISPVVTSPLGTMTGIPYPVEEPRMTASGVVVS
jgi:hypothetical protein